MGHSVLEPRGTRLWLAFALVIWMGCSGVIAPEAERGNEPGGGVGTAEHTRVGAGSPAAGAPPPAGACRAPGPAPLRRLTRFEYANTVEDLLGIKSRLAARWIADGSAESFENAAAAQKVTSGQVGQFMGTAEEIADQIARAAPATLGCDPAAAGCPERFIDTFGRRAFRRPLTDADRQGLRGLFARGQELGGPSNGVRLVVEALLQSPHFLYRVEASRPDGTLSSHATASRLSYLFWASMPDDALTAAADRGALGSAAQIEVEARRLLRDPRARRVMGDFHRQWFGLEALDAVTRDPTRTPGFAAGTGAAMREGTEAFLAHVFLDADKGDVAELLAAPYGFANAATARFFDLAGAAPSGKAPEKVALDPQRRAGLLTEVGLMTMLSKPLHTDIVGRGVFVRKALLCGSLVAPPDEIPELPPPDPKLTTRELFTMHRAHPQCAACHQLIDPIGFAFERYDTVGRYRTTENGRPIDARGEVVGSRDADGVFEGALELAARLGGSGEVSDCVVSRWFQYAFGRHEHPEDACTFQDLRARLGASGGRLRELLVGITQVPAFSAAAVTAGACAP